MNKYKHGNWCCKPANEDEAKEIVERAVASGAELYESVGSEFFKTQYRWDFCSAWGVLSGKTYTCDAEIRESPFANAEELTIEQVREHFPLPSKVDWSKAPHDAQFYSSGAFRKQESGEDYRWEEGTWRTAYKDSLAWHEEQPDFELRQESVQPNTEKTDIQYTHEYNDRGMYKLCTVVVGEPDTLDRVLVENQYGEYDLVYQSDLRPLHTKRDKWVDAALSTVSNTDNGHLRYFAELIYDAITCGDLELPEVGNEQRTI